MSVDLQTAPEEATVSSISLEEALHWISRSSAITFSKAIRKDSETKYYFRTGSSFLFYIAGHEFGTLDNARVVRRGSTIRLVDVTGATRFVELHKEWDPSEDARVSRLEKALELALKIIVTNEPGDSRAVSDEFVAMASVLSDVKNPAADDVIAAGLSKDFAAGPPPSVEVVESISPALQNSLLFAIKYAGQRNTGAAGWVIEALQESWSRLEGYCRSQAICAVREAIYNLDDWKEFCEWTKEQKSNQ